jgi:hypothetical protein
MTTKQTSALQPLFGQMTLAQRIKYNLQCFESDPAHNQFAKGMKQMLDDLLPYAEYDAEADLLEALQEARKFILSVTPRNIGLPHDDIVTFIDTTIARAKGGQS